MKYDRDEDAMYVWLDEMHAITGFSKVFDFSV